MILAYITFENKSEACLFCEELIKTKLIKCANILEGTSVFEWQEHVAKNSEAYAILKLKKENQNKLLDYVETHHSYDTACCIFVEPDKVNEAYLKWVNS